MSGVNMYSVIPFAPVRTLPSPVCESWIVFAGAGVETRAPDTLTGKLKAGPGLSSKLIGTTQRTDGTTQVTYNGHPLYFYVRDTKVGDTIGQGVGTRWWVLSAAGTPIGA